MRVSTELVEISSIDDSFPAEFHWRIVTERRRYTMAVVGIPDFFKSSVQITGIPENYMVQKLVV